MSRPQARVATPARVGHQALEHRQSPRCRGGGLHGLRLFAGRRCACAV